jgi:two-component system LytT family response regulator
MKTVIIEDENIAAQNLERILKIIAPDVEVLAVLQSVEESVEWFTLNPAPDLLFLDIHLADGSSFAIFDKVDIQCPVIFTTAYDEYALRAFKVNSIDYLLKPIGKEDIEHAFDKLQGLQDAADKHQFPFPQQENELLKLIHSLQKQENYKSHFLIPTKGDKLLPVSVDMIQLFYIKDCQVKVVLTDETEYCFSQTLDELTECLNPSLFFRANRQYLISREAIKDIDLWFNSRLSINLYYSGIKEKILVSKARVAEFKEWFSKRKR